MATASFLEEGLGRMEVVGYYSMVNDAQWRCCSVVLTSTRRILRKVQPHDGRRQEKTSSGLARKEPPFQALALAWTPLILSPLSSLFLSTTTATRTPSSFPLSLPPQLIDIRCSLYDFRASQYTCPYPVHSRTGSANTNSYDDVIPTRQSRTPWDALLVSNTTYDQPRHGSLNDNGARQRPTSASHCTPIVAFEASPHSQSSTYPLLRRSTDGAGVPAQGQSG